MVSFENGAVERPLSRACLDRQPYCYAWLACDLCGLLAAMGTRPIGLILISFLSLVFQLSGFAVTHRHVIPFTEIRRLV